MIPKDIIKLAESRKDLGGVLQLIGKYKGKEVYSYVYSEPMTIGMPEVYLWDGVHATLVGGENALVIISSAS